MFKHHLSYVYMKNPVGFPNGMMKTQFKRIGLDLLAFNEAGDALQSLAKQFYEDFQRAQGCQAMPAGGGKDTLQRRELAARPPLHSKPLLQTFCKHSLTRRSGISASASNCDSHRGRKLRAVPGGCNGKAILKGMSLQTCVWALQTRS